MHSLCAGEIEHWVLQSREGFVIRAKLIPKAKHRSLHSDSSLTALMGFRARCYGKRETTQTNILNGPYLYKWLHLNESTNHHALRVLQCPDSPFVSTSFLSCLLNRGDTIWGGKKMFLWHCCHRGDARSPVVLESRSNNTQKASRLLLWLTSSLLTSFFLIAFWAAAFVATRSPSAASLSLCCWSSFSG